MGATQSSDWSFEPKVWQDHIRAYFDRKLVFGAMAMRDDTLMSAPGETINFPYFKKIGDAEEPAEDQGLAVDKLQDDSFSATVKEVGKAVGVKKKALVKSAASRERIFDEAQEQIGRVHAEKVDKDLIAEINTVGNYVQGYTAAAAADVCNVANVLQGKIIGFGDKHTDSVAIYMHSLHELSLLKDSTTGFLKADANDPFWGRPGFAGRLLGMAVFTSDNVPEASAVGGKKAYHAFVCKANPYGIMYKEDMEMDSDYDMLQREWVFAGTQWYAVKAFHAKIASDDLKICRMTFATEVNA